MSRTRRSPVRLLLVVALPLVGCGSNGVVDTGAVATGAQFRCPPATLDVEPAPPLTTLPTRPGADPLPVTHYTLGAVAPEVPTKGPSYCFQVADTARADALRAALDARPEDMLTIEADAAGQWSFRRSGPSAPYGTTIPGDPPSAAVVPGQPSAAEAKARAEGFADALGLDGVLAIDEQAGRWIATIADPDLAVVATTLTIAPGNVIESAGGFLGTAVRGPDLPLADVATLASRLNAPLDAIGEGRQRTTVILTGPALDLALVASSDGHRLVPEVRFEQPGATVVAVSDELLR